MTVEEVILTVHNLRDQVITQGDMQGSAQYSRGKFTTIFLIHCTYPLTEPEIISVNHKNIFQDHVAFLQRPPRHYLYLISQFLIQHDLDCTDKVGLGSLKTDLSFL